MSQGKDRHRNEVNEPSSTMRRLKISESKGRTLLKEANELTDLRQQQSSIESVLKT